MLLEALKLGGRTAAIYLVTIIMVKLMGKREIGQLSPMDFVVGVIIGSVAAAPMVDLELSLLPTLAPIVVLGLLEIAAAKLALKSQKIRLFLKDKPTVLIRNGRILLQNLAHVRMNLDDVKQELRAQGVADINEVAEGTLESDGSFSIIKKPEAQPLTPQNLQAATRQNVEQLIALHAQKAHLELQRFLEKRTGN
ncbi:MAG: DUF421 domain-containing protein [Firmicutes bacterium]|nr:DUF421 domain-containing protein [Bacillota bacterium]